MANQKNKKTIPLEFVAEMITVFQVMEKRFPTFMRGRMPLPVLMEIMHQMMKDQLHIENLWDEYDKALEEGIKIASMFAVCSDQFSDLPINRRIQIGYALNRFIYFDLLPANTPRLPNDPRIQADKKNPSSKENTKIMNRVFESLQHWPSFKEEREKQIQAGRFKEWKTEQRDAAINTYHKISDRWQAKVDKYSEQLRQSLLEKDSSEKTVKTSEKYSHAKKTGAEASNGGTGAKTKPLLASTARKRTTSKKRS